MLCLNNILLLLFAVRSIDASNDWNHLMFSQSWPSTVCRIWKEKDPAHTCTFPRKLDAWSIHGIWPAISNSTGPSFCNDSWPFDPDNIKPIQKDLEQGWINVEDGTSLYDLWTHEWNKHGTCAAILEPLNSQIKYFSQGLKWLETYTMVDILAEAKILPSNKKTYNDTQFYRAVRDKLGVDPDINCLHDKDKQYLWELRICFSKEFEMINCKADGIRLYVSELSYVSNCDASGIIYENIARRKHKRRNHTHTTSQRPQLSRTVVINKSVL